MTSSSLAATTATSDRKDRNRPSGGRAQFFLVLARQNHRRGAYRRLSVRRQPVTPTTAGLRRRLPDPRDCSLRASSWPRTPRPHLDAAIENTVLFMSSHSSTPRLDKRFAHPGGSWGLRCRRFWVALGAGLAQAGTLRSGNPCSAGKATQPQPPCRTVNSRSKSCTRSRLRDAAA